MGKIVIDHAPTGVVLDIDTLTRFIDEARAAADGHIDSIETLPSSAKYVADMLAPLLGLSCTCSGFPQPDIDRDCPMHGEGDRED